MSNLAVRSQNPYGTQSFQGSQHQYSPNLRGVYPNHAHGMSSPYRDSQSQYSHSSRYSHPSQKSAPQRQGRAPGPLSPWNPNYPEVDDEIDDVYSRVTRKATQLTDTAKPRRSSAISDEQASSLDKHTDGISEYYQRARVSVDLDEVGPYPTEFVSKLSKNQTNKSTSSERPELAISPVEEGPAGVSNPTKYTAGVPRFIDNDRILDNLLDQEN